MNLALMNEIINQACQEESESKRFQRSLATRIDSLHKAIILEGQDPALDLSRFALDYIKLVPEAIGQMNECIRLEAKYAVLQPSVDLAIRLFTQPADTSTADIFSLLPRAYQCHRLIEELYDNNHSLRTNQYLSNQITQANLLAHQLVSEEVANDIDGATFAVFGQLVSLPDFYQLDLNGLVDDKVNQRWATIRECWKTLLTRHNITMTFTI